jgi:23S rRNA pseudouridine1911/1915/1917 synthase
MSERQKTITIHQPGERLDKAVAKLLPDLSRSQVQRLIDEGRVTIDGKLAKAAMRLEGGERATIAFPPISPAGIVAESMALDIRYEDNDILVVNKPAGIVVHPSPGHDSGTLVNGILAYCPELEGIGGKRRPGIVHRLDKETSGLIVVAKNDRALRYLQDQFRERRVGKRYLALVEGRFHKVEALIDAPIGRDQHNRKRMAIIAPGSSATARPAQTLVTLLQAYEEATLLACRPQTGRTHQIRVHLAFAGFPIVGDKVYGHSKRNAALDRHFLHAAGLTIRRPSDKREMDIEAELPEELNVYLEELTPRDQ